LDSSTDVPVGSATGNNVVLSTSVPVSVLSDVAIGTNVSTESVASGVNTSIEVTSEVVVLVLFSNGSVGKSFSEERSVDLTFRSESHVGGSRAEDAEESEDGEEDNLVHFS